MKNLSRVLILALALTLTGCSKGKVTEMIIEEDSKNIKTTTIEKIEEKREIVEESIEEFLEEVPKKENDFKVKKDLFSELDKIMSLDYVLFKETNLKSTGKDLSEIFKIIEYNREYINEELILMKESYDELGEVNDRTLEYLYKDVITHRNNKNFLSNSMAHPKVHIQELDRYADLIEERDIRLERFRLDDIKNLNLEDLEIYKDSLELQILSNSISVINDEINIRKFATAEYKKLNLANKVYMNLMFESINSLRVLGESRNDVEYYDFLKPEKNQEVYKLHIKDCLEEAFKLKKEIDKIDVYLEEITKDLDNEAVDAEKDRIEREKELEYYRIQNERNEELEAIEQEEMAKQRIYKINDVMVSEDNDGEFKVINFRMEVDSAGNQMGVVTIEYTNIGEYPYEIDFNDFSFSAGGVYKSPSDAYDHVNFKSTRFSATLEKGETLIGDLIYIFGVWEIDVNEEYSISCFKFPQSGNGVYSDAVVFYLE